MSAKVVFGVPASEYMETDYLDDAPQVHLHFLTGPDEYREQGYGRVELCCHGCGAGLLVLYNHSADAAGRFHHVQITDTFAEQHGRCPNRSFEHECPPYRSSMSVVDLRTRQRSLRPVDDGEPPRRVVVRVRPKPAAA